MSIAPATAPSINPARTRRTSAWSRQVRHPDALPYHEGKREGAIAARRARRQYLVESRDAAADFGQSGNITSIFTGVNFHPADMNRVATDDQGDIFAADYDGQVVWEQHADGTVTQVWNGASVEGYPSALAVDSTQDVLYVGDDVNHVVWAVQLDGGSRYMSVYAGTLSRVSSGYPNGPPNDGGPATAANFQWIAALAVDGAGNLFIADDQLFLGDDPQARIREVNALTGNISTVAVIPYSDCASTWEQVCRPEGLAVGPSGTLYVADAGTDVIEVVNPDGSLTVVAGQYGRAAEDYGDGWPATSAWLDGPTSIAVDAEGDLFIPDDGGNVVREVTPDGIIHRIAGNGASVDSGDGGPALSAGVDSPVSLAVTSTGALVIGETSETRSAVREVIFSKPLVYTMPGNGLGVFEGSGGGNPSECSCDAPSVTPNPVNTASGEFWHTFTDLSIPGRGPSFDLTRTYSSNLAGVDGPFGYGWASPYLMSLARDSRGDVQITQENGSRIVFSQNSDGTFSPAEPRLLATLSVDRAGNYVFTRKARETFVFNAAGQLLSLMDLNGNTTTLSYSEAGVLSAIIDPAGRVVKVTTSDGLITAVTDPLGRTVNYAYDANSNLRSVSEPTGAAWTYGYDGDHLMTTMLDPDQQALAKPQPLTNIYDSNHRVVSQSDYAGRTTTFAYSGDNFSDAGGTTTVTDPLGGRAIYNYIDGMLQSETTGAGTPSAATTTYSYSQTLMAPATITDADGHTTHYNYDAEGNTTGVTDALGRTTAMTYDGLNDLLTSTDPKGVMTTDTYDARGNLLSTSLPVDGAEIATTTFTYGDPNHPGDVTAVTDPAGNSTSLEYDADGDLGAITDPTGARTTWVFDAVGRMTSTTTPGGATTSYTYDADGRVLTITDSLGRVTAGTYNRDGDLIKEVDPAGNVTTMTYDADGELVSTTHPDGAIASAAFDQDGRVISETNADGRTTSFTYNPTGRLTSITDPLGRTTSYMFDLAGNETGMVNASGQTTNYSYDADNELAGVGYSDGVTPDVTFSYDADGHRTSMTDGTGTTSYTYDDAGRLLRATDGDGQQVGYDYNLDGDVTDLVYPNGQQIHRSFDAADRLTAVTDWRGNTTSFQYSPDGDVTSVAYPNSVTEGATYDQNGQIATLSDTVGSRTLASYTYARNADNQITSATATGAAAPPSETYDYNSLGQLVGYGSGTSTGGYSYDPVGNITELADGSGQVFDAADELTESSSDDGASTAYGYNLEGDRTSATTGSATVELGYDQSDRLVSYVDASVGTAASYAYNGDGLRVSRSVGATGYNYVYDQASGTTPLVIADGHSYFVYGPNDVPIEQISGDSGGIRLVATGGNQVDSNKATAVTVGFSAVAQPGDQILLVVNTSAREAPTPPAGYVSVGTFAASQQHGATTVFRKTATGGESGVTVTMTDPPFDQATTAQVLVYRGVDSTSPIEAVSSAGTSSAGDTSITVPGVTTVADGDQLVVAEDSTVAPPKSQWTPPAGMTARDDNSAKGSISELADQLLPGTGPTGSRTAAISAPGELEAVLIALRAAGPLYLLHDQQGSTRVLTDSSGNVVGAYQYDPYGATTSHTGSASTPLRYDGQYQDDESGLYYLENRYYAPTNGQFITRDPLEALTNQPYQYANADPLDSSDPTGLCSQSHIRGPAQAGAMIPWGYVSANQQMNCASNGQEWQPIQVVATHLRIDPFYLVRYPIMWAGTDEGGGGSGYDSTYRYIATSTNRVEEIYGCLNGDFVYGFVPEDYVYREIDTDYNGDIEEDGGGSRYGGQESGRWKPGTGANQFQPGYGSPNLSGTPTNLSQYYE